MRTVLIATALLAMPVTGLAEVVSQPPPPGATSCTGCHGSAGIPLDTLSAAEIETAMEAFRSGSRSVTLMNRIAAGFTAEESAAIARWLARE